MANQFLLLLLACHFSLAQQNRSDLTDLISAENAFAQQVNETSIKAAFLANLDSTGVLFDGSVPVNGIKQYSSATENKNNLLSWYPVTAQVSVSGDIGFTSGPYKYFAERGKGAIGSGYFFSIWKRNENGKFKLVLDGGTYNTAGHDQIFEGNLGLKETGLRDRKIRMLVNDKKESPWASEELFSKLAKNDPQKSYQKFLGDSVWTLRSDKQIARSKMQNLKLMKEQKVQSYDFKQDGLGMSSTMDLAYCYGQVKEKNAGNQQSGFYVRIWQFQTQGWRIIADVISLGNNQ